MIAFITEVQSFVMENVDAF